LARRWETLCAACHSTARAKFFEALWTNFRPFGTTGILDWYTILTGLTALFTLTLHGSLWVAMKTTGPLQDRARKIARVAWWLVGAFTIIVTFTSFKLQPHLQASFSARPWGYIFPAFAAAGLLCSIPYINSDGKAFAASCIYLTGMLASVAFGLYPEVLPASGNAAFSLTIETAKAPEYGLKIGLVWWIAGMLLATIYLGVVYWRFAGKVSISSDGEG
jgi:cytochrome d ubiquinol oxidase subunit II